MRSTLPAIYITYKGTFTRIATHRPSNSSTLGKHSAPSPSTAYQFQTPTCTDIPVPADIALVSKQHNHSTNMCTRKSLPQVRPRNKQLRIVTQPRATPSYLIISRNHKYTTYMSSDEHKPRQSPDATPCQTRHATCMVHTLRTQDSRYPRCIHHHDPVPQGMCVRVLQQRKENFPELPCVHVHL